MPTMTECVLVLFLAEEPEVPGLFEFEEERRLSFLPAIVATRFNQRVLVEILSNFPHVLSPKN